MSAPSWPALLAAMEASPWSHCKALIEQGARWDEDPLPVYAAPWEQLFPNPLTAEDVSVLCKANLLKVRWRNALIHHCVVASDCEGVGRLLDAGEDPSRPGNFGLRPLTLAIQTLHAPNQGKVTEVVQMMFLLLSRGADPNALGLGSTGRAAFEFVASYPEFYQALDPVQRDGLWLALDKAGIDWSLPYEDPNENGPYHLAYFAVERFSHRKSRPEIEAAMEACLCLEKRGISFVPASRPNKKWPTLGKYAAQVGPHGSAFLERFHGYRKALEQGSALQSHTEPVSTIKSRRL